MKTVISNGLKCPAPFPFSGRQVIYSACCFGGHDAPCGIPSGRPGYFRGDLRKLRIIQR